MSLPRNFPSNHEIARVSAIEVELYHGARADLRSSFEHADDSPAEIDAYIDLGEVLVVRSNQQVVGHLQLIADGTQWEIKSLAVIDRERGQGIGTALVRAALSRACAASAQRVVVATATADVDNLRFYQRLGFRMDRIERDAFSVERGYPDDLTVDGMRVRDRVWLSLNCENCG
jgi:ribosomal protein S18 acetylase RimI-like enzyme